MSESAGKNRKRYVDNPKDISIHTCPIHIIGHSSDGCKVLGDFGSKYSKNMPTKDCGHDPVTRKKCNIQQENNYAVNNEVYEIILQDNNKVSAEAEAHGTKLLL